MADKNRLKGVEVWPMDGTPLVADVQAPGFLPVTEESLDIIVQRLALALNPHKIVLFGSYSTGLPLRIAMWIFWLFWTPQLVRLIAISVSPVC